MAAVAENPAFAQLHKAAWAMGSNWRVRVMLLLLLAAGFMQLCGDMLPYVPYQLDWGVEPDEPVRLTVCGLVGDGWWQDAVW